jgi:phenylacetate-CoA ligase
MNNYLRILYYLSSLLRHTHWREDQLQEYRDKKVRQIVRYAYENVEFYHRKFLEIGVRPEEIRSVEDLSKLPIIRRNELQENSGKLISRSLNPAKLRVVSTSGSSGRPLFTYLSRSEDEFRKAKLLRPHVVCGQKPRDKWVLIEPTQHIENLGRLQRLLGVYSPNFVSIFDDPDKQLSDIERLDPDVLDGYSNSLFMIAQEFEERGTHRIDPRFVMGGAESIDNVSRRFLEEAFEAPFYDQYATEELQMIAWQCPGKDGYHIDADSVVVQFVSDDGNEVSPGERGELVCTSLFNRAMPFIRYALGDVGVPSAEKCSCGRTFPMMKLVEGRKDSIVVLPNGRKIPALVFGWMMEFYKYYNNIYQYRIIQKKINLLRVIVKKKSEKVADAEMREELLRNMQVMLEISEPDVKVEIEFVDDIPLDKSGKLRKVISEIQNSELGA